MKIFSLIISILCFLTSLILILYNNYIASIYVSSLAIMNFLCFLYYYNKNKIKVWKN